MGIKNGTVHDLCLKLHAFIMNISPLVFYSEIVSHSVLESLKFSTFKGRSSQFDL
jgi:hypothetical protein